MTVMSYYLRHVFICTNSREAGKDCCATGGAEGAGAHLKDRVKELELNGPGRVRVSTAGCLGRCGDGPVLVVYPEGVWYTYVDNDDLDEIIERHLVGGETVERLLI